MLRNRLLGLLLGTLLVPLLGALLVGYWLLGRELEKSLEETLKRTGTAILQDLDAQHQQLLGRASEMQQDERLLQSLRDSDRQRLLEQLTSAKILTGVGYATVIDAEGRILASGHDPGHYGQQVTSATRQIALMSRRARSGLAAEPTGLELEALVPLRDGDRFLGLLDLAVPLDHAMLTATAEKYAVELSVFSSSGAQSTTLHDPSVLRLADAVGGDENTMQPQRLVVNGEKHTVLHLPLEDAAGTQLGHLQVALSHQRLQQLQKALTAVMAALITILVLTVIWLSRRVSRGIVVPLGLVADQAQKISQGDFTARVRDDAPGEIGQLARAFNHMAAHLGESTTSIDRLNEEIAARGEAEEALRASRENLRITLNSIGDGVLTTDHEGRVTGLNPAAERLTGWTEGEAVGRRLQEVLNIVHGDQGEPEASLVERVRSASGAVNLSEDTLLIARDGTMRRIAESAAPIRDGSGEMVGVVLVFRDVTEAHELQIRLQQAQKMETIGQLAGGVAHDFNNMLAAIVGSAELLSHGLPSSATEERSHVTTIMDVAHRASALTNQLLDFSRRGKVASTVVDLHEIVGETFRICERSIDKRIELEADLRAEQFEVEGDAAQLQGALLNLCVNARDAMPEGGRLIVRTRNETLDERSSRHPTFSLAPGPHLLLQVEDTGTGMEQRVVDRIFEPFYTTKEIGKGTGLGLSAAFGIIRSHHGAIECESEPGKGTTFTIHLPISRTRSTEAVADDLPATLGRGSILLVDDEEMVCSLGVALLAKLGYEVTGLSDPGEAVDRFAEEPERFDLVLLDLMMPKLSGKQVYEAMKEIRPDVRVAFISGFGEDHVVSDLLGEVNVVGFLQKPYRSRDLSRLLSQALPAVPVED